MTAAAEATSTSSRELAFNRVRLTGWMSRGIELLRNLGPYALIEIFLPGGTLIALLLWLHRKRQKLACDVAACG